MIWRFSNQPWGAKPEQIKIEWPLLRRVFGYFVPYWVTGLGIVGLIAVEAVLGLVPAKATQQLIDYLTWYVDHKGGSFAFVLLMIGAIVGSAVANGLLGVIETYGRNQISQSIMFDLRNQLFGRLLAQSLAFFTRTRTGDVMSRLSNDVNGVQSVVSDTIFSLVSNLFLFISTIVFMIGLSWDLTIASLLVIPAFILPTRQVGRATFDARKQTQAKLSDLTAYMQEVLGISGILLVKAFVRQEMEMRRFSKLNSELRDLNVRQAMIGRWFFMVMAVLAAAGPAVLWLFGGYLVLRHAVSIGTVAAFATVLLNRLYGPVGAFATLQVSVTGSLALFKRLFDYLDLQFDVADAPHAVLLDHVEGAVSFDDVTFRYESANEPALKDVSFRVLPGQLVALVGPSGAGKTTVTALIPRFFDPQLGCVRVDDSDVRSVSLESLGRQIGIVFQDTFLFHTSVRDNLLYARPKATEEEVIAAAKAAYIHDFITRLPQGYDTIVGERGHRLSGGERQRMAIARVILKDPRILILDEATSNLDSESEFLIQAALRPLYSSRTSIVIAHRLSTILAADVILVFDRGKLLDRGSHAELLARDGLYARLYERQFIINEPQPQLEHSVPGQAQS